MGDSMTDLERFQQIIDESNYIVFFGGAGVSTESGIKDFRGKNGLYKTKPKVKTNKPPEYMLSHDCLYRDPELFFEYYKENMDILDSKPNVTHKYLKKLEDNGKLKAIITQNVDGLHQKAGSSNVLEIHGNIRDCYCIDCGKEYNGKSIFKMDGVPKCDCGGIIRPDVVLFGEMLPACFNDALDYIGKADLLIVAGTSLAVEPAASLVRLFSGKNLVIINDNKTPYDMISSLVINKPLKDIFGKLK